MIAAASVGVLIEVIVLLAVSEIQQAEASRGVVCCVEPRNEYAPTQALRVRLTFCEVQLVVAPIGVRYHLCRLTSVRIARWCRWIWRWRRHRLVVRA